MKSLDGTNATTSGSGGRWVVPAELLPAWSAAAAFGAYFCMYGFRKPFTAASYIDESGVDGKALLVVAQVLGYMLSKFIGIRVIAEMTASRRAATFLTLIAGAETALLLFGLVPPVFRVAPLFVNGLFLGMVFGLVLGFLEGRRITEVLTAALCASFILGDGFTKSVGAKLLEWGVTEAWMPALAGLTFVLPLLLFVWMLTRIPPPTEEDVMLRHERAPMSGAERREFFLRYAAGLVPLIAVYLLMTILRSIRADFAPEIWKSLGRSGQPSVFTQSELFVTVGVTLATAASVLIRDNRRAFFAALGVSLLGMVLTGLAPAALEAGAVNDFGFMVLVGLGVYLPYVTFHTTIFERLIAMTRERGNMGFLMYLADAFGYLGYVAVVFAHMFAKGEGNMLEFFTAACGVTSVVSVLLLLACWRYFSVRSATAPLAQPAVETV